MLENNFLPVIHEKFDDSSNIFVEDNNTWREELKHISNIPKILWPSQSLDLNPIENLWLQIKKEIEKTRKTFRYTAEVMETICNVWDSISVNKINDLYKSLPEWLKELLKTSHNPQNLRNIIKKVAKISIIQILMSKLSVKTTVLC